MKKSILYLMHVPWQWIKQRPHFIAEKLGDFFHVDVMYEYSFNKKLLVNNEVNNDIKVNPLYKLPFSKYKIITVINNILIKFQIKKIVNQFSYIWITDPTLYYKIKKDLPNEAILVYGLDDFANFLI